MDDGLLGGGGIMNWARFAQYPFPYNNEPDFDRLQEIADRRREAEYDEKMERELARKALQAEGKETT